MMKYALAVLAASAVALPATAADRKLDAEACAKAVAPFLDDSTFAVLHVDLKAVDVNALAARYSDLAKSGAGELPGLKEEAAALKKATDAGACDLFIVFSLADVPERPPFAVLPLEKDGDAKTVISVLQEYRPLYFDRFAEIGGVVVGGEDATIKRLRSLEPDARPELAKAFAAADGGLAQLAVIPPKDAAKIIDSVMPTLPAEVGGGSSKVLTNGFRWAAVGLDAPKLKLNAVVQASDAEAARALLDLLDKTIAAIGKSEQVRELLPDFDKLTRQLTPKLVGDRLTLTLDDAALTAVLRQFIPKAAQASDRVRSENHLKQLALAALNYEDAHRRFPANATYDKKGKALLSWRVHLLPYLGEDKLYKEFHLDEPWDGEHNKKLIARMPAVFGSPTNPKLAADGKTTYLAPVGDATMFPAGRGVSIAEVTDGTSNTILFVDASDDSAVVWTKPEDLTYDPKAPAKGLGFRYPGALVVFVDGSTHLIPKTVEKATLQGLFTRNGGEVVTPP